MHLHANAKLGLAGRRALVRAIEQGSSVKAAAAACRWLEPPAPDAAPPRRQRRICAARRRTGWGPRLLTLSLGHPHATISKVLRRHGLSRSERPAAEPARRYEWPCPGDLLYVPQAGHGVR